MSAGAAQTRSACGCACSGGGGCGSGAAKPKGPSTAYIALGSNLGDRVAWIEQACAEMDRRGIKVKRTSSLWETEPMYVLDQDRFVNGVCEVSDTHSLNSLRLSVSVRELRVSCVIFMHFLEVYLCQLTFD